MYIYVNFRRSVQGIILNLLRRHVVGLGPEVDLLVLINAGDDEEDPGAPRLPRQHPAQPEHHRPLVLLHHLGRVMRAGDKYSLDDLDDPAEGDREGDGDQEEGDHSEDEGGKA